MKKIVMIFVLMLLAAADLQAQSRRGMRSWGWSVEGDDSLAVVQILPVPIFSRPKDLRRYWRLVRAVKRVYPVAQLARGKMAEMESELKHMTSKKEQRRYVRGVYRQIVEEYTPVVRHMTRTDGRVLLKLIDRETDYTAFEVLREFRGGFVAGFWQCVSRIFGQNLKSEYDREGDDKLLEQIVVYYEAGLL